MNFFRRCLIPLLLLVALLAPARALAHMTDEDFTLTVTCDLFDDHLDQTVYIPVWFLVDELYGNKTTVKSLVGKSDDCKAQCVGWMAHNNPILIDGKPVRPQVVSMTARSMALFDNPPFPDFVKDMDGVEDAYVKHNTGVKVLLRYPLAHKPQTVSIRWRRYMVRTLPDESMSNPPVGLAFFNDDKHRITDLTPQEPEWVWHASGVMPPPASALVVQKWEPVLWRLPVGALAVFLLGLATMLALSWRQRRAWGWAALIVGLGLGSLVWQRALGVVAIPSPFQKQLSRPTQAEAQVIFRDLLQGVYKAFDFNTDSNIYDALAHCVDGPILEQIYQDVQGSLVLDDQAGGGAICQVEKVEVQRSELLPAMPGDESDTLHLECAWTVRGKVSHWGHTHTRANAYKAQYTLAVRAGKDGPRWKITGCKVTEQKPLEIDGKKP